MGWNLENFAVLFLYVYSAVGAAIPLGTNGQVNTFVNFVRDFSNPSKEVTIGTSIFKINENPSANSPLAMYKASNALQLTTEKILREATNNAVETEGSFVSQSEYPAYFSTFRSAGLELLNHDEAGSSIDRSCNSWGISEGVIIFGCAVLCCTIIGALTCYFGRNSKNCASSNYNGNCDAGGAGGCDAGGCDGGGCD